MNKEWLEDFYEKGFVRFFNEGYANLVDIDSFDLKYNQEMLRDNGELDLPPIVRHEMCVVGACLESDYLDEMFEESEFMKYVLWEGVDADTATWHNDGFEGMNAFFLLYFDDMNEEIGGEVGLKWGDNEETFYPKRGDILLLNQNGKFFHRAEKSTAKRRQASFDFVVK